MAAPAATAAAAVGPADPDVCLACDATCWYHCACDCHGAAAEHDGTPDGRDKLRPLDVTDSRTLQTDATATRTPALNTSTSFEGGDSEDRTPLDNVPFYDVEPGFKLTLRGGKVTHTVCEMVKGTALTVAPWPSSFPPWRSVNELSHVMC